MKAAALASFADEHQDSFGRIDLIVVDKAGKPDARFKRLQLVSSPLIARTGFKSGVRGFPAMELNADIHMHSPDRWNWPLAIPHSWTSG